MEFNQLVQFKCIAEKGTVSAAAEALYISQPGLSRSLQRLEEDLGTPLFFRDKNRLILNPAGVLFLQHACAILDSVDAARNAVREHVRNAQQINISSCSRVPLWKISRLLSQSENSIPIVSVLLRAQSLRDNLLSGSTDLAVSVTPLDSPFILCRPFYRDQLLLCADSSSPLGKKDTVHYSEMDGMTFYGSGQNYWVDFLSQAMPRAQFKEISDSVTLYALLGRPGYYGFTSTVGEQYFPVAAGRKIPVGEDSARTTWYLNYLAENQARLQPLLDLLLSEASN